MSPNTNPMMPFQQEVGPVSPPVYPSTQEPGAPIVSDVTLPTEANNRHAEAGRKGGHRFHQLVQLGLLYEKEHGLKRGRQRVRQLIQEGRLYEQEHGLGAKPRRPRRVGGDQLVQSFLRTLLRMVKPTYRDKLTRLIEKMEI